MVVLVVLVAFSVTFLLLMQFVCVPWIIISFPYQYEKNIQVDFERKIKYSLLGHGSSWQKTTHFPVQPGWISLTWFCLNVITGRVFLIFWKLNDVIIMNSLQTYFCNFWMDPFVSVQDDKCTLWIVKNIYIYKKMN